MNTFAENSPTSVDYTSPTYAATITGVAKSQPVFSPKSAPAEWRSFPTSRYVVLDTEAHGLEARFDAMRSFYCGCLVVVGDEGTKPSLKSFSAWEPLLEYLQPLHDEGYALVCHNAKFDIPLLTTRGFNVRWKRVYCTQVLAYLQRNDRPSFSLDALTGAKTDVIQELKDCGTLDENTSEREFWAHDWSGNWGVREALETYCTNDTKVCHKLYKAIVRASTEQEAIAYTGWSSPCWQCCRAWSSEGYPLTASSCCPLWSATAERWSSMSRPYATNLDSCLSCSGTLAKKPTNQKPKPTATAKATKTPVRC